MNKNENSAAYSSKNVLCQMEVETQFFGVRRSQNVIVATQCWGYYDTVAPKFDHGFIIYRQREIEIQECKKSKFALF